MIKLGLSAMTRTTVTLIITIETPDDCGGLPSVASTDHSDFRLPVQIDEHALSGVAINVWRADLVPAPPLPAYVKMVELVPFVEYVASGDYKAIGYYASKDSDWVRVLPEIAARYGLKAIIGYPKSKKIPDFITAIEEHVTYLRPNVYPVNFAIMRRQLADESGYLVPMGLDHPYVVAKMTNFLAHNPLPKADTTIVPTGSGIILASVLNHLQEGHVVGVCSRPIDSVQAVLKRHAHFNGELQLVAGQAHAGELPWPMHRFWEALAYGWLQANIGALAGRNVSFLNLGS
jgi:hypothetical protein